MEFDNHIENKHKNFRNNPDFGFRNDNRYPDDSLYSGHKYNGHYKWVHFIDSLKTNKKLRLMLALAVTLIVAAVIGLILVLLPFILKLFNYINQNGLQGIVDYAADFLNKLWQGSGK